MTNASNVGTGSCRASCAGRLSVSSVTALAGEIDTEPDAVYTPDRLGEMLPHGDYVVLMVPHAEQSHHMIDETALRAMQPSAVLINLARGGVVEEHALIQALREG